VVGEGTRERKKSLCNGEGERREEKATGAKGGRSGKHHDDDEKTPEAIKS
jgi:hypothetical protein